MSISENFKIIERLGNQKVRKFGELYFVERKQDDLKAVMKVIKKRTGSELIENRLRHESTFSFDLEGLPKIIDVFESDTELIVIRSFKAGVPLDKHWAGLKRKERSPFLLHLIEKLDLIFEHLEKEKIVHCDIKPGNIIVGENNSIDLIDFGLSLRKENLDERTTLFPLGFAAPELLLNKLELVNQSTDIYALGILIWRLYTNRLPLAHPNPSVFTNLQLTHPLPDDSELPKRLFPILLKMTNKHQFKVPPNKMDQSEVRDYLKKAIENRYTNLHDVQEDMKQALRKRSFLPGKIFSKS